MSSKKQKSYFFYLTSSDLQHYSKNIWNPFSNDTADNFLDTFKDRLIFENASLIKGVVYIDSTFTFHLPPKVIPLQLFPQLKYELKVKTNDDGSLAEETVQDKSCITLVDGGSELYQRITIKFQHLHDQLGPIIAQIPFVPDGDNIVSAIKRYIGDQTWETQFFYLSSVLNLPFESVILRYSDDSNNTIIFPFTKIVDILELFFNSDGTCYNPHGEFKYDISYTPGPTPTVFSTLHLDDPSNKMKEFSASLLQRISSVPPSKYISSILEELRLFFDRNELPLDVYVIESLKDAIYRTLPYPFINYLSRFLLIDKRTNYQWHQIDRQIITDYTPVNDDITDKNSLIEFLIAICLGKWSRLPCDIVDRFHNALNAFRQQTNPQNKMFFGYIVYSHFVNLQGQSYTIILTRSFIHLFNFTPKKTDSHEVLPETYNFICGNKTPLLYGAPIQCVKFTQVEPGKSIGILSTPQGYFTIDFGPVEALYDFWLMLEICQNETNQPIIQPQIPDLHISITFPNIEPIGKHINADIEAGQDKWSISYPFFKFAHFIDDIYNRLIKFQILMPLYTPMKLKNWMFNDQSFECMKNKYLLSTIGEYLSIDNKFENFEELQSQIMYSMCIELATNPIKFDQFRFFILLGITDFNKAITNNSLTLFNWQLKNFGSLITSYKIEGTPFLHFSAMFIDNLEILQSIINRYDINETDDDKRTALFYSIRSPTFNSTQMLFEKGIDPYFPDNNLETPFCEAVDHKLTEKTIFLIRNFKNSHMQSLVYCLETKNFELFNKLLKYCPSYSLNSKSINGSYLIHVLIKKKAIEQLYLLSQRCPEFDPNLYSDKYPHAVHFYFDISSKTKDFNLELFNALLSLPNLDLNIRNDKNETPLCRCLQYNNVNIFQRLVSDPRCDLDLQNENNQSCLYLAVEMRNVEFITILLKAGVLVNAPNNDEEKNTPLFLAVKKNDLTIIELLVNYSANPNKWYNADGNLPQHIGSPEVLQRMKEKGFQQVYEQRS
ncbi:serine/threonine-protein phosphatase 6 regulatory ankyrin repeat subunit A-like [Histomonas meleagridis]|uniref:serine/threonine-protein phosphatase 6 regulatory ankyrin repeat subunit A-like n=1 Tax=Histomonas meleagridis TaxID=135588 RepID=UPI00355A5F50|nr:serine/threonine-protein phosphatase 6 regulatory ankyrin repeat subunit A-like [Histomonas meleagridis]KAH0801962.1 serine/threonine-protein phosphatase 6 regulatory ankyrin repeat subunit A-like [Histomonas meleagridis]